MSTIFLSHSSLDRSLANVLSHEIEKEFENRVTVFASSRPNSIPSGSDWQDKVLKQLDAADILIILMTTSSENSLWVGFELGYFWKKTNKTGIHVLYASIPRIPSPLDTIQAKSIMDSSHIKDFFEQLSKHYKHKFENKVNFDLIVETAKSLTEEPPERSIGKFEKLLATSSWNKREIEGKEVWICQNDAIYQIVIEPENDDISQKRSQFDEEWTRGFPDPHTYAYNVTLNISGQAVEKTKFISLDGGRYFVPLPEIKPGIICGERSFYVSRNSLGYKLYKVIGHYYFEQTPYETFAERQGIEISDS